MNSESFSASYIKSAILFCHNSAGRDGGAVKLIESSMTLKGSVIFKANKALNGGGISINMNSRNCYSSFIIFQEPLDLLFYSNSATYFGGALYIVDADPGCREWESHYNFNCFFTVNVSTKFFHLNFTGNKASEGTAIYGGRIQYCEMEIRNQRQKGYNILQNLTNTSTKIQNQYAINNPFEILLCKDTTKVQRGQVFNISVTVLGEFDVPVYESVTFTINYYDQETSSEVVGQPYNNLYGKGCRILGFSILSRGQTEIITLHLPQCFNKLSSLRVTINLHDCPPGFELIVNS